MKALHCTLNKRDQHALLSRVTWWALCLHSVCRLVVAEKGARMAHEDSSSHEGLVARFPGRSGSSALLHRRSQVLRWWQLLLCLCHSVTPCMSYMMVTIMPAWTCFADTITWAL